MAVKDLFRLPLLFLFIFILVFLLLFALSLLSYWGSVYSVGRVEALRLVEAQVPPTLVKMLPVSVLLSLVLLLFRIAYKPGSRLLSLLIPLVGAFVLLAVGYPLLRGLGSQAEGGSTARAAELRPTPRLYLSPGVFNTLDGKVVYPDALAGQSLSSVLLLEGGSSGERLLYFNQGRITASERVVTLRLPGYVLEADAEPVYAGLFQEDPVLRGFLADVRFLESELDSLYRGSLALFYFSVVALVISFYSLGLFLRLSRWPLLNVVLALLAMRGLLLLIRFLREGVALELAQNMSNPQTLQVLPELTLLLVGTLLLFLDLLFLPFRRRDQE